MLKVQDLNAVLRSFGKLNRWHDLSQVLQLGSCLHVFGSQLLVFWIFKPACFICRVGYIFTIYYMDVYLMCIIQFYFILCPMCVCVCVLFLLKGSSVCRSILAAALNEYLGCFKTQCISWYGPKINWLQIFLFKVIEESYIQIPCL